MALKVKESGEIVVAETFRDNDWMAREEELQENIRRIDRENRLSAENEED